MIDGFASTASTAAMLEEIHALALSERSLPSQAQGPSGPPRIVPSASALSVAIEGPGLFVFQRGSERIYSRSGAFRVERDGALTNAEGDSVMGYAIGQSGTFGRLAPIVIPADAVADARFATFSIDARGVLRGHLARQTPGAPASIERSVPIAHLALAIFPAPERLARAGETAFRESDASGVPVLRKPGDANTSTLRTHALESGLKGLQETLRQMWLLARRAEFQTAVAAAKDQCAKTALGLVK